MRLETGFEDELKPPWRVTEIGQGRVHRSPGSLRLTLPAAASDGYHDAQISDYEGPTFAWKPPVRMTVTAYATPEADYLRGTAGFGFWNQPFMPGRVSLRLPQAVWFFFSSAPSNMQLAMGVPGPGWKAATFNARSWRFLALLPTAPLGVLLMRFPALYQRLWPVGQRALGVSERLLDSALLAERHSYRLEWRRNGATFAVDGITVHEAETAPRGSLGFVAWIDNQYAIATPQGRLGFGLVAVEQEQTLVLEQVVIEALEKS